MNKKSFSVFYTIYCSFLIVFLIALIIFATWLSGFIREYNLGIPETVSQKFFTEVFEKKDIVKIKEMTGIAPSEFETQADIEKFLERKLSGELSFTSVSSENSDKNYIVKSDGYKVASFTLSPDEKNDYFIKELSLNIKKDKSVICRIFEGSKLYINGVEVSDTYITERSPYKYNEFLPEFVKAPMWRTYTVSDLTKDPDVSVTDRNGNAVTLTETDGVLTEEIIYDVQDDDLCYRLMQAAKEYAKCMQNDAPKSAVYPYLEKDTELYNSIRTVETGFAWDHSGYGFENESCSEFMRYDENTVSARIAFTHILRLGGKENYKDYTDMTLFARKIDGVYKIFARINN